MPKWLISKFHTLLYIGSVICNFWLRSAYINFWSVCTYQSWDPVNDVTNRHYSTKFALSTNSNFTHDLEVSIQLREIPPLCVLYYKKVYNQRVKYYKKLLIWSTSKITTSPSGPFKKIHRDDILPNNYSFGSSFFEESKNKRNVNIWERIQILSKMRVK